MMRSAAIRGAGLIIVGEAPSSRAGGQKAKWAAAVDPEAVASADGIGAAGRLSWAPPRAVTR